MYYTDVKTGEKIGVVTQTFGTGGRLGRAGTVVAEECGTFSIKSVTETTPGAIRIEEARQTIPKDVVGIVEIRGNEGIGTHIPIRRRV